jgi:hypothetical protein
VQWRVAFVILTRNEFRIVPKSGLDRWQVALPACIANLAAFGNIPMAGDGDG